MNYENNSEIQFLREYLRIHSVHPNVDYEPCLEFLKRQAAELDLTFSYLHPSRPNKPVIIITWTGLKPELPAIMLNSHMDVAPVFPEYWVYSPFSAHIDECGMIYGRGIQDSKALAIQYLGAIRALKKDGFRGQRTVHVTFMPDAEIGSNTGMRIFVGTNFFKKMNVGFVLDGGISSAEDKCPVFYAERIQCQPIFNITGTSGDVSLLPKKTAGEKLNFILKKLTNFREKELRRLRENNDITLGDVTTVNLTMMNSKEGTNVLPSTIKAHFDIRLSLKVDPEQFIRQLHEWAEEAGGGIEINIKDTDFIKAATTLDDKNEFWLTFKRICEEEKIEISPLVLPGASDNRFVRFVGIPALNFSPMPNTPNLSHDHNECLHADIFLQGIEFYKKLIPALLNTGVDSDE